MAAEQILLIHTAPNILEVLKERVQASGYEAAAALNTAEAAWILSNQSVDLIICENAALRGGGADFLEWVQDRLPNAAVVVLSSWSDLEMALEGLERALNVKERVSERRRFEVSDQKSAPETIEETLESEAALALERQYPGITKVRRDSKGFLILGDR